MIDVPCQMAILAHREQIPGDDALLRLAQARLSEAGLGGEFYPGDLDHLQHLLQFRPAEKACTAHLPRGLSPFTAEGQEAIAAFAERSAGRLYGLIVHDKPCIETDFDQACQAVLALDQRLASIHQAPHIFVEYAAMLAPDRFAALFEQTPSRRHVFACIDAGHVGLAACRQCYAQDHGGADPCAFHPHSPDLEAHMAGIQNAARQGLPAVIDLTCRLGKTQEPLHFHLHDAHPLSTLSPYGVCDHLSFTQHIDLPFAVPAEWANSSSTVPAQAATHSIAGVFGPDGLKRIVQAALTNHGPDGLSFMLEIHPQEGRSPLQQHSRLFAHWQDLSNAECMQYWLDALVANGRLLREACAGRDGRR